MHDDRLRTNTRSNTRLRRTPVGILVALLTTALGGFALQAASPAHAEPDIKSVKEKVDALYHQAEVASERYNTVNEKLTSSRAALDSLNSDLKRQQSSVDTMRSQVAALVVQQYQGQALSTATQVVLADNPDTFLDNLTAISAYDSQRGEVMDDYTLQLARLELRKKAVAEEAAQLAKLDKQLAADKSEIDAKAAQAKKVLDDLEAKQAAKLAALSPSSSPSDVSAAVANVPASGRAGAAVSFALAQVGKAYVWGAAGPSAYDCSGLTMAAWGRAGVGLSHSSRMQYNEGAHVSESQLQPGDLVFYYSPISHVGMYIGGGKIVHAANPGAGVRIDSLHTMPFVGAVRPG